MRLGRIAPLLGLLLLAIGIAMLLPLFVALLAGSADRTALALSVVTTMGFGLALRLLGRDDAQLTLTINEGVAAVVFGWVCAGLAGALPFLFAGVFASPVDALFESVSGFTTTGATALTDFAAPPPGVMLWRSMSQWLGGIGIILLLVALWPALGVGAYQLFQAELPGPTPRRLTPRLVDTARVLWRIYLALSAAEFLGLLLLGVRPLLALHHVFTTMPTGGYSPLAESIAGFENPLVEYWILLFMIMAGINFSLYFQVWRKQSLRPLIEDGEFRFYLGLLGTAMALLMGTLFVSGYLTNFADIVRYGSFQTATILTTTGYATADFNLWPDSSRLILMVLMFTGGSSGSTGGGIKQLRLLIWLQHGFRELKRVLEPNTVSPIRVRGELVAETVIKHVQAFVAIYLLLFTGGTLVLGAFGLDVITAASATIASLGNIGPGFGLVGPMENYASLPAPVKLLLAALMITGRLEVFPVLALLLRRAWKRGRQHVRLY